MAIYKIAFWSNSVIFVSEKRLGKVIVIVCWYMGAAYWDFNKPAMLKANSSLRP